MMYKNLQTKNFVSCEGLGGDEAAKRDLRKDNIFSVADFHCQRGHIFDPKTNKFQ